MLNQSNIDTKITTFSGSIDRVLFHDEGNNFSILAISSDVFPCNVTVLGELPSAKEGEFVTCVGGWKFDAKRNQHQMEASSIVYSHPNTLIGVQRYLASGVFEGIGEIYSRQIVEKFGMDIFYVLEECPEHLLSIYGLGQQRIQNLVSAWHEQKEIREIMVFLQSYGLTSSKAVKIHKHYGSNAIAIIKENPYRLTEDMFGFGFKTCDIFALSMGFDKCSELRIASGIKYTLSVFATRGNCAVTESKLITSAVKLLNVKDRNISDVFSTLAQNKTVVFEKMNGQVYCYLPELYEAETGVVSNINRILNSPSFSFMGNTKKIIKDAEISAKMILSIEQRDAIETALNNKISIITGGPGVGKTTIINVILKCFERYGSRITLCAPTGKAARRMTETTGMLAKTAHRTLEYDGQCHKFRIHKFNQLITDVVVIDESSMMDIVLMNRLLEGIPSHAQIVIVGDKNQLPSVGAGTVLSDFIKSGVIPTVHLTKIYRQAEGSKIITNSHRVNSGLDLIKHSDSNSDSDFYFIKTNGVDAINSRVEELIFNRIPNHFGFKASTDIQVLTPTNKGVLGTRAMNKKMQMQINPNPVDKINKYGTIYGINDRVMQVVNNYEKNVFNGETGIIVSINHRSEEVIVDFDKNYVTYSFVELDELNLAYVITIHKSQGSEYPVVIIPLSSEHGIMLERNLLYTGMTRGKQLVIIIGEQDALDKAIKTIKVGDRVSLLVNRLKSSVANCEVDNIPLLKIA